jgi:deazaflavin-dependent oxidoreductase (nitroreductase family)
LKPANRNDQKASLSWSPPRWTIPLVTRLQSWIYEKTGGRIWTRAMRMHHLLLRNVGRRSGRLQVACLPFWLDADEHRIVVASFGGGPRHPAWYHNLCDTTVNPELIVRDKRRVFWAKAQVLMGEERAAIWKELTLDRPFYEGYQAKTQRVIPLVRLVETRPYEG